MASKARKPRQRIRPPTGARHMLHAATTGSEPLGASCSSRFRRVKYRFGLRRFGGERLRSRAGRDVFLECGLVAQSFLSAGRDALKHSAENEVMQGKNGVPVGAAQQPFGIEGGCLPDDGTC